jgi:hypothetical protein
VAVVGVTATRLTAGTHYDVSPLTEVAVAFSERSWVFAPGSWPQLFWLTLLPQLVIWPAYTVVAGMAGAALGFLVSPAPAAPAAEAEDASSQAPRADAAVETSDAPSTD